MANDLITRTLNKAAKEQILVEIYLDSKNPNHFIVGEVQGSCVAGVVVVITFNTEGKAQNIHVVKLTKIIKVRLHSKYLNNLAKLSKNLHQLNTEYLNPRKVGKRNISKLLREVRLKSEVVTIQVGKIDGNPNNLDGFVLGYDNKCIQMKVLNDFGEENGIVVCRKKHIDSIELGTKHQRKLKILGAA